ncbi:MAG: EAL domain-containing protein [Sulfuricurvum sp.]|jgi:EAL domain-containing protein (putative c-di-GMP-specific phosphodiesterase class I)/GGDEF domain-containing protein
MRVDTKKFFVASLIFCITLVAIGIHDYNEAPDAIFETIAKLVLLLMGALPFLILYRNMLSRAVNSLSEEMEETSERLYETTAILEEKVEEKTKELLDEGFRDSLTHLPNRHRLIFDMDRYKYHALIIIQLYNFKELTHFFGNAIGESLLQQFGLWLTHMHYNAYRLGSHEFALLIEQDYSVEELISYCNTTIDELSKHAFSAGNETVSLILRMGIDASDNFTLAHADTALHSSIRLSQDFMFYESATDTEAQYLNNIQTASNIREAFHAGRIICHYQPIISTLTGKIDKYETLARLIDTNGALIPPHNFLNVSQKTRLYPQITQEIVRQACETFKGSDKDFSIHLCALDVMNETTINTIKEIMMASDTAHQIIFELSEEDIYEHYIPMALFMKHMKSLGARIAIDNFGSSYSNFDKIIHLDIDYLKIDGSLINKIMHSQEHAKIIQTIASLANAIGAQAIAENVETAEILAHIQNMEIAFAQGYHIGKPGPYYL